MKEAIGLEPERVGVGAFVLGGLVPYIAVLGEADTVAIVDLGATTSEVLILEHGEAVSARTLSTGTDGLPAAAARLARDIGMTFAGHQARGRDGAVSRLLVRRRCVRAGAEGFLVGRARPAGASLAGAVHRHCADPRARRGPSCPATPRRLPWPSRSQRTQQRG